MTTTRTQPPAQGATSATREPCTFDPCDRPKRKGYEYCQGHQKQLYRERNGGPPMAPLNDRFSRKAKTSRWDALKDAFRRLLDAESDEDQAEKQRAQVLARHHVLAFARKPVGKATKT